MKHRSRLPACLEALLQSGESHEELKHLVDGINHKIPSWGRTTEGVEEEGSKAQKQLGFSGREQQISPLIQKIPMVERSDFSLLNS
jgi:hypothetical protein